MPAQRCSSRVLEERTRPALLRAARRNLLLQPGDGRHRALALAAQFGHTDTVRMLLDAGEEPSRYNPIGCHAHSTPLHQAALAGHIEVVRLLVEAARDWISRTRCGKAHQPTGHGTKDDSKSRSICGRESNKICPLPAV